MRYFFSISFRGKNHSARSERLSPLTWVSGWGEEIWKDDRGRGGEKEEQLHDLKWCWLDDIESSCAKVEESNAFSLSISLLYSLPSLALLCLAAKPSGWGDWGKKNGGDCSGFSDLAFHFVKPCYYVSLVVYNQTYTLLLYCGFLLQGSFVLFPDFGRRNWKKTEQTSKTEH